MFSDCALGRAGSAETRLKSIICLTDPVQLWDLSLMCTFYRSLHEQWAVVRFILTHVLNGYWKFLSSVPATSKTAMCGQRLKSGLKRTQWGFIWLFGLLHQAVCSPPRYSNHFKTWLSQIRVALIAASYISQMRDLWRTTINVIGISLQDQPMVLLQVSEFCDPRLTNVHQAHPALSASLFCSSWNVVETVVNPLLTNGKWRYVAPWLAVGKLRFYHW